MAAPIEESEKHGLEVSHIDDHSAKDAESNHVVAHLEDDDFGFTPAEQRRIIRRIDRRLVITVGAMYCVSLMDRTNMSAANIAGMSVELVLINNRYVSPFTFTYTDKRSSLSRTLPTSSSSPPTSSSSRRRPC